MIKRSLDLVLSLVGSVLAAPILIVLGLAVLISLGPPVLFIQPRPGLHGRLFRFYKFRTMTDERDDQGNLLPDESRLTDVGRWLRNTSLDELPQLINVLKGDMTLVGPRPLLVEYLPLYSSEQARRHEVKPGITGWVQVNGRNALSWEEKFILDVWYVEHQTFWLDLRILWMTFARVVQSDGINQAGQATMERFSGGGNSGARVDVKDLFRVDR
jgi:sugar transferase EpsL